MVLNSIEIYSFKAFFDKTNPSLKSQTKVFEIPLTPSLSPGGRGEG